MASARLHRYSELGPEGPLARAIWRAMVSQGARPSQLVLAARLGVAM